MTRAEENEIEYAKAEIVRLRAWAMDEQKKREAVEEDRLNERQESERLRNGYEDIKRATIEGRVCDDVAWFDTITTLHDFCDMMIHAGFVNSAAVSAGAEMNPVRKVARAIDGVQLFSRINDWTRDRMPGFPIEICRYGKGVEPEIVVVKRFRAGTDEGEALRKVVSEQRARAAISAMAR